MIEALLKTRHHRLIDPLLSISALAVLVAGLGRISPLLGLLVFLFAVACTAVAMWSRIRQPKLEVVADEFGGPHGALAALFQKARPVVGTTAVSLPGDEVAEVALLLRESGSDRSQQLATILSGARHIPLTSEVEVDRDRVMQAMNSATG